MNPDRLRALRILMDEALAAPDGARDAVLQRVRGLDEALAGELEALLERADGDDGRFRPLLVPVGTRYPELAADQRLGAFRLVRPLGQGGMGDVWLAERDDGAFAQLVAIKSPRSGVQGLAALQRFERERALLAALEHPGIARLVDGGATAEGRPWLAMEFVEGRAIDHFAAQEGLDFAARVALLLQVARALAAAHLRLILHRDLKPANVLVRADGRVALLDFGIGALLGDAGAATRAGGSYLGTPRYASPEQLRGEPCTLASDVYALAALARELCAPHGERLDPDLEAVLAQASQASPERRTGSADHFAAELTRWLEHRPVEARQASAWHRGRLFVRRNPLAAMALAGAACCLLFAFVGILGAWRSELAERQRAEAAEARATSRLDDVYSLIASLVGGIHDRLGSLVGAVPVRDYVVETAERYLAALESEPESTNDERLGRALAEVHLRLAEVRGARTQGSRGEIALALAHVERAMPWIEAEAGLRGTAHVQLEAMERRLRALRLKADLQRASGAMASAEELYDEVLAGVERALAANIVLNGAQLQSDPRPVLSSLRSIERTRAAALMQRGRTRFERGQGAAALADLEAAGVAFAALLASGEQARLDAHGARRDLALLRAEQGRVLAQLGQAEPALQAWRAAAELLSELELSAPADGQVERDRLELEAELATTQADLGDVNVAEEAIGRTLAAARDLARRDADNLLATRVLRLVLLRGARVALARNDTGLALERYDEAAGLARLELAAAPDASAPRDAQAALDLAECQVMGAEAARRAGASEGLAARFEAGLAALPASDGALARGEHFVGNLRAVAAVGLGSLLGTSGDHQGATRVLDAARTEARAWSESHGALQWPLRCEAALEYALGSSHETLASAASDRVQRIQHLGAARDAFLAGLAAAQRLEREGRVAPHEKPFVGYFSADVARVEAALAGP